MFARPWAFVKSVFRLDDLPPANRLEVAFVGRSNVGKSSLLNALTRQKRLARTSSTPGRTQCLNFFEPEDDDFVYMVDVPGYGYAKAPKEVASSWQLLLKDYLRGRPSLQRVFLLIDSRHGLKDNDKQMMQLLDEAAVTYQLVLTKSDKVSALALEKAVQSAQKAISDHPAAFPIVLCTSAEKRIGIETIQETITEMRKSLS